MDRFHLQGTNNICPVERRVVRRLSDGCTAVTPVVWTVYALSIVGNGVRVR